MILETFLEELNCHGFVLINSVFTDWLQSFYIISKLKLVFMDRYALSLKGTLESYEKLDFVEFMSDLNWLLFLVLNLNGEPVTLWHVTISNESSFKLKILCIRVK